MPQKHIRSILACSLLLLLCLLAFMHPTSALAEATTVRVSVASDGTEANNLSWVQLISADGRYVTFYSTATNLVPGDTNGKGELFLHDLLTGKTTPFLVASDGNLDNSSIFTPDLSPDGRWVAFDSSSSNLVPGDTNGISDIFVHDRQTGETTRVSVASNGAQANNYSYDPKISADGRFVAFESWASNLVSNDTNDRGDIFVHDRLTGVTTRVSVASNGAQANTFSWRACISANGRYVAFASYTSDLVTGDTNGDFDVFVHDRQTGNTTRVSVASDGAQANDDSPSLDISSDGRYVVFESDASNLVANDTNNNTDIFIHDRQIGNTTRVSVASDGAQANDDSSSPGISSDGRYVVFESDASNLVANDTNNNTDIFIHDRQTGVTVRISVAANGAEANYYSYGPIISADNRYVAFTSNASNLVPGDTNRSEDSFVRGPLQGDSSEYAYISDIPSPQSLESSLQISLTHTGGYTGTVRLGCTLGPVYPSSVKMVDGKWSGEVTLFEAGKDLQLTALIDGDQIKSNLFEVTSEGSDVLTVTGRVEDFNGNSIPDATVYIGKSLDQSDWEKTTVARPSNVSGTADILNAANFQFDDLPPGRYYVWATYNDKESEMQLINGSGSRLLAGKTIRICLDEPSDKVPVLFLPGIMGSSNAALAFPLPRLPRERVRWLDGELHILDAWPLGWVGWDDLRQLLQSAGYVNGFNIVDVPYDWRDSIDNVAKLDLKEAIKRTLDITKASQVDIVAHSMGGLVARAYIQSDEYGDDVRKLIMVGTPNHGSAKVYNIVEGGNVFGEGDLVYRSSLTYLYNQDNKPIPWKTYTYANGFFYWKQELALDPQRQALKQYIDKAIFSAYQLLPSYQFLKPQPEEFYNPRHEFSCDKQYLYNIWLSELNAANTIDRLTEIETTMLCGTSQPTWESLSIDEPMCSRMLYPNGIPTDGQESNLGDGTVLNSSTSLEAELGAGYGCTHFAEEEHAYLVNAFKFKIVEILTGEPTETTSYLGRSFSPQASSTAQLLIALSGRMQGYLESPSGTEAGIKEGALLEQITGSSVEANDESCSIILEDPVDGTYTLVVTGVNSEDFGITLEYAQSDSEAVVKQARAFKQGDAYTITFTLDSAASDPIAFSSKFDAPGEVQASPVDDGGGEVAKLTWQAPAGVEVSYYQIYSKVSGYPYLSPLGTSAQTTFTTTDAWVGDCAGTASYYAVSAVLTDSSETLLSSYVDNNDRDHDGLSDCQESEIGSLASNPDTDGDGLDDFSEYARGTRPDLADTDGDGYSDYVEVEAGTDPLDATSTPAPTVVNTGHLGVLMTGDGDQDQDGIPDNIENKTCTSATNPDSDDDGIPDGVEDSNRNGVLDEGETNPCVTDSDGDGLGDGEEDANHNGQVNSGETDPTKADTDGDGYDDGVEISAGSDPLNPASRPGVMPTGMLPLLLGGSNVEGVTPPPPPPPPVDPYGPNLMQGVYIYATNSTAATGHKPDQAVDGDESTFWATNTVQTAWGLRWDMGASATEAPDRFGMLVGGDGWWGVTDFTLQALGADGWTNLLEVQHSAGLDQWQYWDLGGEFNYRYYRLLVDSTYQDGGLMPSIKEMSLQERNQ